MRRVALIGAGPLAILAAVLIAVALVPEGAKPPRAVLSAACPQAAGGHGSMGICAPRQPPGLTAPAPVGANAITYPDLSNNDPVRDLAPVARHGHPAIVLKVNQGTGYIDPTFRPMVVSARAHGLAVGGYDFVSSYTTREANRFVALLKQAGLTRGRAKTLPPTLDVEYGPASRAGVQRMVNVLHGAFGRVNIYTGAWYWTPHMGCWWPKGVTGWLAGYPSAPRLCGMPATAYTQHQYTDRGFNGASYADMNLWLGTRATWAAFTHTPKPKPKPRPPVANTLPGHYPDYKLLGHAEKRHADGLLAARRFANRHHGFDRAHHTAATTDRGWLLRTVQALEHTNRARYHRAARIECIRNILHANWKRGR